MRSPITLLIALTWAIGYPGHLKAQETVITGLLPVSIESPSLFENYAARAVVSSTEPITLPEELPSNTESISFLEQKVVEIPAKRGGGYSAVFTFLPIESGLLELPAFTLEVGGIMRTTVSRQIQVSVPQQEPGMSLSFAPDKNEVFAGEPVRIMVTWNCDLPTVELKELRLNPDFFNDTGIEIEIPRTTLPKEKQVGIPVGGRRVIAERDRNEDQPEAMGSIRFPVWVRFPEPGEFTFGSTRLNIVRYQTKERNFAPYASYFNNSLFEAVGPTESHSRLYTESEPFSISVRPLPGDERASEFSGLFAPCQIKTEIRPDSGTVGQLMELTVSVLTETPPAFLELPDLSRQPGLRHQFWIDEHIRQVWRKDGADFLIRFRPLTTGIRAFPSLAFQLFDATSQSFQWEYTPSLALAIAPQDGKTFFDRSNLRDNTSILASSAGGVWHNEDPQPLEKAANRAVNVLAEGFWIWLIVFIAAFALLIPVALERRRRALDPGYHSFVLAYSAFRKLPENREEKWQAFRSFLATLSGSRALAFTVRDAEDTLNFAGVDKDDTEVVCGLFEARDKASFKQHEPDAALPSLNPLAARIFRAGRSRFVALILGTLFLSASLSADEWTDAQGLFRSGLDAEPGSAEALARFSEAALSYEEIAREGKFSGTAWYNAGNSWFEAGQLGRAIAAFRHARIYRPFDNNLEESLDTTRALVATQLQKETGWRFVIWPVRWLKALFVPLFAFLLAGTWLHMRYRNPESRVTLCVLGVIAAIPLLLLLIANFSNGREGVIVAGEVGARKGPAYRYNPAFDSPLSEGLECRFIESRGDWTLIRLSDERECWVPSQTVSWLEF